MNFFDTVIALLTGVAVVSAANDTLLPFVFQPLFLGSIKPQGWLRDQMELMADGLAGHEQEFYRYVNQSSWLGDDQEYSSLNEGFPYWFNGLVPLAYGLDDARLKSQVQQSMTYVIEHQQQDGWIGPETTPDTRNFWARYPIFLGLIQLVEADPSQADRIIPAMHKFVNLMNSMLANNYTGYLDKPGDTFDASWGRARSHDMIISLQWLLEKNPANNTQRLVENMKYLNDKAYDWAYWWQEGIFIKENLDSVSSNYTNSMYQYEHGVNVGQGLKALAVVNRFTNNGSLPEITRTGVNWTFTYHGASSGTILGDEREMGLSPYTGSELCTAVETMYSMSYLYQTMGDNEFADRCELAAFNALPVMMTPDHWGHQYMAEPNQPYSRTLTETPFFNVNTLGQSFGLEPNYPCCTVNHPQGYPKFLSASFVGVGDSGLGHALLSPANVTTTLGSGNAVTVSCNTDYPFGSTLVYTINAAQSFDFFVRVPSWYVATTSSIILNNGSSQSLFPNASTGMHMISINSGQSTITYTLGAAIVIEPRANSTITIHNGALLYALFVGAQTSVGPPTNWQNRTAYPSDYAPPQSHDWTITNNTPWNYAIDPSTLKYQPTTPSNATIQPLPNPIFTAGAPPGNITALACEIAWPIARGVPAAVPLPGQRNCTGPTVQVTLVPYGAAKIHMAEYPTVQLTATVARMSGSGRARGVAWSCAVGGLVGLLAWGMWDR